MLTRNGANGCEEPACRKMFIGCYNSECIAAAAVSQVKHTTERIDNLRGAVDFFTAHVCSNLCGATE